MIRRLTQLTRGVAALAALALLLAGVPLLLWAFGGVPGSQILDTLNDQFASDNTRTEQLLAGTLTIIAWLCWAQLAYAITAETVAAVAGRAARRAPILPGLQALAYRLVTSATLIITSLTPAARAVAAPLIAPPADPVIEIIDSPEIAPVYALTAAPTAVGANGSHDPVRYTVGARETLWSVAERTLGNGLRWVDIRDTNVGRTMPDGTTITAETETIRPGWTLALPAGAVMPYSDQNLLGEHPTVTDASLVEVVPGDHLWGLAEHALTDSWGRAPTDPEIGPYWADVIELNTDRLLPPHDPDLIYPRQILELPPTPADPTAPTPPIHLDLDLDPDVDVDVAEPPPVEPTAPEVTTPTPVPTATTTPTPTPTVPAPTTAPTVQDAGSDGDGHLREIVAASGLAALGIGAGAITVTLRRRRGQQAAKRQPGTVPEPSPVETIDYQRQIRHIADTEAVTWIETTNRLITHRLADDPDHPLPAVIAMRAGQLGVELLLDDPCPPLPGFHAISPDNTAWRLDGDLDLAELQADTDGTQPYSPALLPVGDTGGGELLLDFEQIGALSLDGEPDAIVAWMRAIATATAITPWATYCTTVAIGTPDDTAVLANVERPDDPATWAERCCLEMRRLSERLTATPYEQRVRPGDIYHPTIVLVGPDHNALATQLADAAALLHTPLAVIAAGPLANADRLHLTSSGATLEPSGIDFTPAQGNPTEVASVALLLDHADQPASSAPEPDEEVTENEEVAPSASDVDDLIAEILEPRPVEVHILTPRPRVHGLGKEPQAKQLSVICYLAYHRDMASQRLRDTFWPEATNRSTADNALSQIRILLGTDQAGEPRLSNAINEGAHQLSDEVGCDWTRLDQLRRLAKQRPADALPLLTAAVGLIEGRPGKDATSRHFAWLTDDIDLYAPLEATLVDAAHRLGELALTAGNPGLAEQAASTGLQIVAGHEALYRIRMQAAADQGDRGAVERIYAELCVHTTALDPWADLDPETVDLYQRLTRSLVARLSTG